MQEEKEYGISAEKLEAEYFYRLEEPANNHLNDGITPNNPGFDKVETANLPPNLKSISQIEGVAEEDEKILRVFGSDLLYRAGHLLKLPITTVITAQIIFHRFYSRKSFVKYEIRDVLLGVLLIACKVEETSRKIRDIASVFYHIFKVKEGHPRPIPALDVSSSLYRRLRDIATEMERIILVEIGFELYYAVEHPHKFMIHFLKLLKCPLEVTQKAWNYANDSFRTVVNVHYPPHVIAVSAIYLAIRSLKHPMPDTCWWAMMEVSIKHILEVSAHILELYTIPIVDMSQLKEIMDRSYSVAGVKKIFLIDWNSSMSDNNLIEKPEKVNTITHSTEGPKRGFDNKRPSGRDKPRDPTNRYESNYKRDKDREKDLKKRKKKRSSSRSHSSFDSDDSEQDRKKNKKSKHKHKKIRSRSKTRSRSRDYSKKRSTSRYQDKDRKSHKNRKKSEERRDKKSEEKREKRSEEKNGVKVDNRSPSQKDTKESQKPTEADKNSKGIEKDKGTEKDEGKDDHKKKKKGFVESEKHPNQREREGESKQLDTNKTNEGTEKKTSEETDKQAKNGPKISIDTQKIREMLKPDIQKMRPVLPATSKMRSEDIESDASQNIRQKIEQIRGQTPTLPHKASKQVSKPAEEKVESQKQPEAESDNEDLELIAIKKRMLEKKKQLSKDNIVP